MVKPSSIAKNSSAVNVTPANMKEGKSLMKKHASMMVGNSDKAVDRPTINRVQVLKVSINFSS